MRDTTSRGGPRPRRARSLPPTLVPAFDWPDWTDRVRYGTTTLRPTASTDAAGLPDAVSRQREALR